MKLFFSTYEKCFKFYGLLACRNGKVDKKSRPLFTGFHTDDRIMPAGNPVTHR